MKKHDTKAIIVFMLFVATMMYSYMLFWIGVYQGMKVSLLGMTTVIFLVSIITLYQHINDTLQQWEQNNTKQQ